MRCQNLLRGAAVIVMVAGFSFTAASNLRAADTATNARPVDAAAAASPAATPAAGPPPSVQNCLNIGGSSPAKFVCNGKVYSQHQLYEMRVKWEAQQRENPQ